MLKVIQKSSFCVAKRCIKDKDPFIDSLTLSSLRADLFTFFNTEFLDTRKGIEGLLLCPEINKMTILSQFQPRPDGPAWVSPCVMGRQCLSSLVNFWWRTPRLWSTRSAEPKGKNSLFKWISTAIPKQRRVSWNITPAHKKTGHSE